MRVMKSAVAGIVLSLVILLVPAQGVVIGPDNVVIPGSAGGVFSFDYSIYDATGTTATGYQSRVGVSGPGTLTFDSTSSQAVANDPGYWVYGNSLLAQAIDVGGGNYEFGDSPANPYYEALVNGDIMARYSFTWGGTEGWYTFTLDTAVGNSFVLNDSFVSEVLGFTQGQYPGQGSSFDVYIPEPSTMALLALGGAGLLKRRRR
jgi:hypothetical protein